MNHNDNTKIVTFVGLAGSGKSTATLHATENKHPKVSVNNNILQAIVEIRNLLSAGQHHIVLDGLRAWEDYKLIKKEFPGELAVVAIVTPKKIRHRRLSSRPVNPMSQFEIDQSDWSDIEQYNIGGPIAVADYYIANDDSVEKLQQNIDDIFSKNEI